MPILAIFLQFFGCVEEAEWAIEVMRDLGVPVACSLRMGPTGDMHNIPPGECAVRMVKAGKCYPCTKDMHNIPPGECAVRMVKAGKYYPRTRDMHNIPPGRMCSDDGKGW